MSWVSDSVQFGHEKLKVSNESNSEASEKMLQILTLVMRRVQSLSPEFDKIREQVRSLEFEVREASRHPKNKQQKQETGLAGDNNAMDDHMTVLASSASVKDGLGGVSPENPPHPAFAHGGSAPCVDWSHVEGSLSQLDAKVQMIVRDVVLHKACSEDKSIKFGGLGLRTLQEYHT